MPYWGPGPDDCDFAFDSVGSYICILKERMLKDVEIVLREEYPEQSIIASLICLRLIGERYPKNISLHFGKRDFEFVVNAFNEWLGKVGRRIPKKYRNALVAEAREEFALFEERILNQDV